MHMRRAFIFGALLLSAAIVTGVNPGVPNCTVEYFTQDLDHFNWVSKRTFEQRYFVYDKYWQKGGPIFFYTGNEASVELYVNATGLMWENAEKYGALLLFAEHRYYGESKPFNSSSFSPAQLQWLTVEQALADFATLLYHFKEQHSTEKSAVIAFGGSYGGMLAAWMRIKYPGTIDGALAASAPIFAFDGSRRAFKGESYWQTVTHDATEAAGARAGCVENVRKSWPVFFALAATASGRASLTRTFRLCQPLTSSQDAYKLALTLMYAWDVMAMGNFPYPSNYLVFQETGDPTVLLPAFPVRAACEHMTAGGVSLLDGLMGAVSVLYNATKAKVCMEVPSDPNFDGIWDYQFCTERMPQETYFGRDGINDMFWDDPANQTAIREHCAAKWGVSPRDAWIDIAFNGVEGASNIVFSNGLYDPWSSGGVMESSGDGKIVAVIIPEGAHHLDLFFAHSLDPESVKVARRTEMEHVSKWIKEKDNERQRGKKTPQVAVSERAGSSSKQTVDTRKQRADSR